MLGAALAVVTVVVLWRAQPFASTEVNASLARPSAALAAAAIVPTSSAKVPGLTASPTESLTTAPMTALPTSSSSAAAVAWTAADIPLPTFAQARAGDVAGTALTPTEALDDARSLVNSPVIGTHPVVRFLDIQLDATGVVPAWVIVSRGLPMQPQFGPVSASPRTFVATYGWAVVSADGRTLLAQVLQSYTDEATAPPLPLQ